MTFKRRTPKPRTVYPDKSDAPKYAALVPMKCKNPRCGKQYFALAWRVKQGRGLYCHRQCAWTHRRKEGWYVCKQCGIQFYRALQGYRKIPKFCSRACYLRSAKRVKSVADWRTRLEIR